MNWEDLNSNLKDLNHLRHYSKKRVAKEQIVNNDYQAIWHEVYKLFDGMFVKLTVETDSYGDNEFVSGIEFVQPKEKDDVNYVTGKNMNKQGKTYEQIISVLKEKLDDVSSFAYQDYDSQELGLGEVKQIEQHGGEEQGSDWYSVQHFIDHDIYIKVSGYYSSYEGTDFSDGWDSCEQVTPQQRTITVYE